MAKGKASSIQEVSRLAGVSVATVSRVIHQNGRFSAATEERVREAMRQLDYHPNALAQGLRTRSMPIVGIIVPDILDDNYALMIQTAQDYLFQKGYTAVLFNSKEDGKLTQSFVDTMRNQNVSGLIYVPDSRNVAVDLHGIPTVFFDREPRFPAHARCAQVRVDNIACARAGIDWLVERGSRRILMLGDRLNISTHQERMQGALDRLHQLSMQETGIVRVDPQRTSEAIETMERLLDDGLSFDAIFATSVRLTIGAMHVLKVRGISPEQVTMLGIGEHRLHRYGLLRYLAIREPLYEMSSAAAETMVALIGESQTVRRVQSFAAVCLKDAAH